jgi:hypothetical protein
MKLNRTTWPALAGIIVTGSTAAAADLEKPAWLTDCSVGIKEAYDSNVFLSGVNNPPPYTVPAGSVAALKDCYSWITKVSPKIGVNFAPLMGATNSQTMLSLAYAPDYVIYHDQGSESYDAQRVLATVKAGNDLATVNADNNFAYIDGSRYGPVYPGNSYSGFGTIFDRARRRQILETANYTLQFDVFEHWFFRPAAALIYNDMMTEQLNTALPKNEGYQNYADRTDVNGGADVGYRITDQFAATIGYRYGQQYQEQYSFSPDSSPNSYQRLLFGIEGNPWKWLNVKLVGGPDFRSYERDSAGHTTPVKDFNPVKYYGEGLVTATMTEHDALAFKYKYWEWLGGTGKVPYTDASYELNYHHKFCEKLGLDLGGKLMSWDFNDSLPSVAHRHDLQYTLSSGLTYTLNKHISFNAGYAFNWGRNDESDVTNPGARQFDQQLISLGTQWKF